ncbi:MAG: LPS export ABC transporter periplasmic protein LptC [Prevotellaceae bacterium]|nr:LPS export ABC transporter periplasmic protein LptC [Prevotella sp.]MDD7257245.1 LPS export ABC transporter periplasmic protein LptC [Prevotellaceae bacterium]MDY6130337.1 LPS export ABC transporter periplasmic protein LptC [Prevotella sp.]
MREIIALNIVFLLIVLVSCEDRKEHIAPAIYPRDSVSVMTSYGVNTLISDSGVIKYKIVTEKWEVNQVRNPTKWSFEKGLFLAQFDEKFHIEAYVQADTAYYYDVKRLWELKGRVRVRTKAGLRFMSEELYWNQVAHEFYSNRFSRIITPTREMQGSYFLSDEHFTHYTVTNSKGSAVKGADGIGVNEGDSILNAPDSVKAAKRTQTMPKAKMQP